jgi:hypothetical protein
VPIEESRTFLLEKQLVEGLASSDVMAQTDATRQLPKALSRLEVSDIGMQVRLTAGFDSLRQRDKLENGAVFHLGLIAILEDRDLVTAESASRELRSRGDLIGWFMLAHRTWKLKRHVNKSHQKIDLGDS